MGDKRKEGRTWKWDRLGDLNAEREKKKEKRERWEKGKGGGGRTR